MVKWFLGPFTKRGYFHTKNPTNTIKVKKKGQVESSKKGRRPGLYGVFGKDMIMWRKTKK